MFLQELAGHDNIIRLRNVLRAGNDRDVYLVFDHMATDLAAALRAGVLQDVHKRYVMYQLLRALKYMHSAAVLHRDIKVRDGKGGGDGFFIGRQKKLTTLSLCPPPSSQPSNLLLNSECHVKLADFGLARSLPRQPASAPPSGSASPDGHAASPSPAAAAPHPSGPVLTDYVATRWYRAPEVLLGAPRYTTGVDLWSAGCILGELLSGRPLFPGASTMDQLARIVAVTGRPDGGGVAALGSPFAAAMVDGLPKGAASARPLEALLPGAPPDGLDLLRSLLRFDPRARLSAEAALAHPYVAAFHCPSDEPAAPGPVTVPLDDNTKLTVAEYRDRLYAEVVTRRKALRDRARDAVARWSSGGGASPAKGG